MSDAVPTPPEDRGLLDRVAGKAKEIAGGVLGNNDLRDEGRLQQAKVEAGAEARDAAEAAERQAAKADLTTRERELEVERHRIAAEEAEAVEREQLERQRALAHANVEREAQLREAAVERQAEAQQAAIDRKEAGALADRLDAEAAARQTEQQAEQAKRTAAALDNATNRD
jgi:uncharacterized protein YjbJ (UPF0337 family)